MNADARAQAGYPATFPHPVLPRTPFQLAMLKLTGYQATNGQDGKRDGRRAAMLQAIEYRASWPALRSWLRGDVPAPKWAMDLISVKLEAYAQIARHAQLCHKPGRGQGWRRLA